MFLEVQDFFLMSTWWEVSVSHCPTEWWRFGASETLTVTCSCLCVWQPQCKIAINWERLNSQTTEQVWSQNRNCFILLQALCVLKNQNQTLILDSGLDDEFVQQRCSDTVDVVGCICAGGWWESSRAPRGSSEHMDHVNEINCEFDGKTCSCILITVTTTTSAVTVQRKHAH